MRSTAHRHLIAAPHPSPYSITRKDLWAMQVKVTIHTTTSQRKAQDTTTQATNLVKRCLCRLLWALFTVHHSHHGPDLELIPQTYKSCSKPFPERPIYVPKMWKYLIVLGVQQSIKRHCIVCIVRKQSLHSNKLQPEAELVLLQQVLP